MKLLRIIRSRFKKTKEEQWLLDRREACRVCPFNSKNVEKIPWRKKIVIKLSDFYSWVTGNSDEDNLGNCLKCSSCSVFYKTLEKEFESCPENRWKE